MPTVHRFAPLAAVAAGVLGLASCAGTSTAPTTPPAPGSPADTATAPAGGGALTVVTHDSFSLSDELVAQFETDSGLDVTFVAPGDAGTLTNQLVLTKGSPLGDVVFGIDNTFAGRALAEGVIAPSSPQGLPDADAQALQADDSGRLVPIDFGDVCLNADTAWFEANGKAVPATLDDLVKPEYSDLLVVSNPASSSPGLAFLTATVGAKGEGWVDYWTQLKDNGLLVAKDWTEAYSVQFSGSAGKGPRPLVLSYATSPAFEVVDGEAPTQALLGTCFRQVEYAGVIEGAANPDGAQQFIEFLLSPEVQADIPGEMYMYPAVRSTELPEEWVTFAPLSEDPFTVPADEIAANRDAWIRTWTSTVIG
ncbi:MAG: thiamine ABC transporter substrate-binding protein [Propionibacteriaceae bacterium]|nr:thiamine ABC transporter substrate-binding protein [Propionibacteriaceae bacterium]